MRHWRTSLLGCLLASVWMTSVPAGAGEADTANPAASATAATPATTTNETDSKQLEKALQNLNWEQFRSVVEAIPKLKADVDAYGPMGWQFVQANYASYGWKRNIDKLDPEQRQQLAELIRRVKSERKS